MSNNLNTNLENRAPYFTWLRSKYEGGLTLEQVKAGDMVIDHFGLEVFGQLIGFKPLKVSGQRDISPKGFQIIREFEGTKLTSYQDSKGVWTIGTGTIKYPNGERVRAGQTCTLVQAEQYLKNDCLWVDSTLDSLVKVPVTQNQFDALASLVYNIGQTQFASSSLLRYLNEGRYDLAANSFAPWNKVTKKGVKVTEPGLTKRRAKEAALFRAA